MACLGAWPVFEHFRSALANALETAEWAPSHHCRVKVELVKSNEFQTFSSMLQSELQTEAVRNRFRLGERDFHNAMLDNFEGIDRTPGLTGQGNELNECNSAKHKR